MYSLDQYSCLLMNLDQILEYVPVISFICWLCRLIRYETEGYARIGVMPRYGDAKSIRWFEVEPCAALHMINCFEDGDEVIIDSSSNNQANFYLKR